MEMLENEVLPKEQVMEGVNDIFHALGLIHPERFMKRVRGIIGNPKETSFIREGTEYMLLTYNEIDSRLFFETERELVKVREIPLEQVTLAREFIFHKKIIPLIWPKIRGRINHPLSHGVATFNKHPKGIVVTATLSMSKDESPEEVIDETNQEVWNILNSIYNSIYPDVLAEIMVSVERIKTGHCIACNMFGPPICRTCLTEVASFS